MPLLRGLPISTFKPILLVFGPTASGKTTYAVKLAKRIGGEVINADSMQIYAGLPILTALPEIAERAGIAHHLFGQIPANQQWSVGTWLGHVARLIEEIKGRGKRPIFAGGTGLYFDGLTKGLAQIPPISQEIERRVAGWVKRDGLTAIRDRLQQVDPEAAARIQGADQQRLTRAMQVFEETGQSLTSFQQNTTPLLAADQWQGTVLLPPREDLYHRINCRFEQMLEQGAVGEVQRFLSQWPGQSFALHKAIGVAQLGRFLSQEISLEQAVTLAKRDSRRYAKRQMTWARRRTADWQVIDPTQSKTFNNDQTV